MFFDLFAQSLNRTDIIMSVQSSRPLCILEEYFCVQNNQKIASNDICIILNRLSEFNDASGIK